MATITDRARPAETILSLAGRYYAQSGSPDHGTFVESIRAANGLYRTDGQPPITDWTADISGLVVLIPTFTQNSY